MITLFYKGISPALQAYFLGQTKLLVYFHNAVATIFAFITEED